MATLSITNISSEAVHLSELYVSLLPGETKSTTRTVTEMSDLRSIHELLAQSKITVQIAFSTGEAASQLVPVWPLGKNWKTSVANAAALPLTGNTSGDVRIQLDTKELKIWNGSSWAHTSSGGDTVTFANIAALDAYDATSAPEGKQAYVTTLKAYFSLNKTSTATVEFPSVRTAVGGGRWLRLPSGRDWLGQLTWYVGPGGNDEWDGASPSTLLASNAEFLKRLHTLRGSDVLVYVLGNLAEKIGWNGTIEAEAIVTYLGTQTTVASGTITSSANPVPASNSRAHLTDSGVVSWAAYINSGHIIYIPTTPSNYLYTIPHKDGGAGQLLTSPWYRANALTGTQAVGTPPAPGETYEVKALTTVPGVIENNNAYFVRFQDFKFTNFIVVRSVQYSFIRCYFSGGYFGIGINGGSMTCCGIPPGVTAAFSTASSSLRGCMFNAQTTFQSASNVTVIDCLLYRPFCIGVSSAFVFGTFGAFDSTSDSFTLSGGGRIIVNSSATLYGNGNTGYGVRISGGSKLILPAGYSPTVTGTSGDFIVNNKTSLIPGPQPSGAPVFPAAAACTTWAVRGASPFDGYALDWGGDPSCGIVLS